MACRLICEPNACFVSLWNWTKHATNHNKCLFNEVVGKHCAYGIDGRQLLLYNEAAETAKKRVSSIRVQAAE